MRRMISGGIPGFMAVFWAMQVPNEQPHSRRRSETRASAGRAGLRHARQLTSRRSASWASLAADSGERRVGPADIKAGVADAPAGTALTDLEALAGWLAARPPDERAEPFTYVVIPDGVLRVAPRRSEHVACAAGAAVLAAGEIGFERRAGRWCVASVSNQSTGYRPDVACWSAVAGALDRLGVGRPAAFTSEVLFRRCVGCGEVNLVRDGEGFCVFCDAELPSAWNISTQISPDPLV